MPGVKLSAQSFFLCLSFFNLSHLHCRTKYLKYNDMNCNLSKRFLVVLSFVQVV